MNKLLLGTAMVGFMLTTNTEASSFEGAYAGIGLGSNTATASALAAKRQLYPSYRAGYNWDVYGMVLGAEGVVDAHGDSYTAMDAGLDAKIGFVQNRWMPYVRLGMMGTNPGMRAHGGVGVQYSLTERWFIGADWATDSSTIGIRTYRNNNFAISLNMRIGKDPTPVVPPVVAVPVEATVAAKAEPTYRILLTDKPVVMEGAKFAFGKARLNSSAKKQLGLVAVFASDYPEARIVVTGYTDSFGNEKHNLKLSAARAEAVKAYLVKKGIAAERISTQGMGASNPVADNGTAEGRSRNRRVEINSVIKEEQKVWVQ